MDDKWLEIINTVKQVEINGHWYVTTKDYNKVIEYKNYEYNQLIKDIKQLNKQIIKLKLSNKYKNILYDLKEWLEKQS